MSTIKKIFTPQAYVDKLLYCVYNLPTAYSNIADKKTGVYYNCGYRGATSYMWDCWNWPKTIAWDWVPGYNVGSFLFAPGTNGVGDWTGQEIMDHCEDVSKDFKNILPGESMLTPAKDHMGTYIGKHLWNGYEFNAVECTPKIVRNGQLVMSAGCHLSYVDAQGRRYNHKGGVQVGSWAQHGKTPWVDFSAAKELVYSIKKDAGKLVIDFDGKGTATVALNATVK